MAAPGTFLISRAGGLLQLGAGALLVTLGFTQVVGGDLAVLQQVFGGVLCTVGGMQIAIGLLLALGVVGHRPRFDED